MSDTVVTTLEIDADTTGADRYSQAMDRVANSAQSGTASSQNLALAVAGVGTATIAALAGLRGFVDYVGNQAQALVDMEQHARLAGVSLREFQQTLFAARASGLKETDFVSGLDRISQDLTDASRGATQFGKLFEANGISIRNANGQLKDAKQALADIANLMAQATPQQQQALAKIVGVSQAWIPFLKQGADGIEEQKKKALDLGIVIDDGVVAGAKKFADEWHTAVAGWDLQFKATLAALLPQMIQLANIAKDVINGIGSFASDFTRLFTPIDQMSVPQLDAQINSLHKFRDAIEDLERTGQKQGVSEGILEKALGLPAGATLSDIDKQIEQVSQRIDSLKSRLRVTPNQSAGINLPGFGEQNDAVDRAINSLEKHNLAVKADAESVGLGAGAMARFRAEAAEVAAVLANGGKETDAQRAKFKELQQEAEDLAAGLAKIKIDNQSNFADKTKFLSPESVQIAQQLRDIYGDDIPAAMASTEAAQMRLINAQKELKDYAVDFTKTFVQGLLQGKSGMDALIGAADQLASKLADRAVTDAFEALVTMDPMMAAKAGIEAIGAFAINAFTGDQKKREEEARALKEAQDQWKRMAPEVKGFNTGATAERSAANDNDAGKEKERAA